MWNHDVLSNKAIDTKRKAQNRENAPKFAAFPRVSADSPPESGGDLPDAHLKCWKKCEIMMFCQTRLLPFAKNKEPRFLTLCSLHVHYVFKCMFKCISNTPNFERKTANFPCRVDSVRWTHFESGNDACKLNNAWIWATLQFEMSDENF